MKTLSVDKYQRVRIPDAKGGQKFAYENKGNGVLTLTEVKPVAPAEDKPAKVRIEKRNGRVVGITDRPINMQALEEALREFP